MSGQATARPWAVNSDNGVFAAAGTQWAIASVQSGWPHQPDAETARANAALIVRAVNCHDELLEALEGLLSFAEDAETKALVGDEGCLWPVEIARAAIARARGEQA